MDSFEAKPGRESKIQEFWYTMDDNPGSGCTGHFASSSSDVDVTLVDKRVVRIAPECSMVPEAVAAEVTGRMTGAGLHPGSFHFEAPTFLSSLLPSKNVTSRDGITVLQLTSRASTVERRKLFRWVPDEAVSEDVRVFLLQAATDKMGGLAVADVVRESDGCPSSDVCFRVTVGTKTDRRIRLSKGTGGTYKLVQVR